MTRRPGIILFALCSLGCRLPVGLVKITTETAIVDREDTLRRSIYKLTMDRQRICPTELSKPMVHISRACAVLTIKVGWYCGELYAMGGYQEPRPLLCPLPSNQFSDEQLEPHVWECLRGEPNILCLEVFRIASWHCGEKPLSATFLLADFCLQFDKLRRVELVQ